MASEEKYKRLKVIKAKHRDHLMSLTNVTGVGIGRKIVGGEVTDRLAIRVYVKEKVPLERLKREERVPSEVEDVPTDVVAIGEIRRLAHTTRVRPARGGDSIGDCTWIAEGWVTVGTLGGLFIDNTDGAEVILSNNHVIAESDDVTIAVAHVGESTVQPGTFDWGSCTTDVIATLKRWVEYELLPNWNKVDGAIAQVVNPGDVLNSIHDIGTPTGHRALTAADESVTTVQKSGRTTGYTQGLVFDVSYDTTPIDMGRGNSAQFEDQILIQPIGGVPVSDHGDSGALVLDMDGKVVGLLFAGSTLGYAIANHIDDVFNELDIRLPSPGVAVCLPLICLREMICMPLHCPKMILCKKLELCLPEMVCRKLVICMTEMAICSKLETICTKLYWPIEPGRYAFIDLNKIPPEMRRSVEKMLEEIRGYQER